MNGTPPSALRIKPSPDDSAPPEEDSGSGTITLTGPDRQAFKDALGADCKSGEKYTVELTATDVSPDSITFTLDDVESEPDEGDAGEGGETDEGAAPADSKSAAMTYS